MLWSFCTYTWGSPPNEALESPLLFVLAIFIPLFILLWPFSTWVVLITFIPLIFLPLWPFYIYTGGSPPLFIPLIFILLYLFLIFILLWPFCTYTWGFPQPEDLHHFLFCQFLSRFLIPLWLVCTYTWGSPPLEACGSKPLLFYQFLICFLFCCVLFALALEGPTTCSLRVLTIFYSTTFYSANFYSTLYSAVTFLHFRYSHYFLFHFDIFVFTLEGPHHLRVPITFYSINFYSAFLFHIFIPLWPFCTRGAPTTFYSANFYSTFAICTYTWRSPPLFIPLFYSAFLLHSNLYALTIVW